MSWFDQLLPASFRGIPFKVSDAGLESGRKVAIKNIVSSNDVSTEDLSRKVKQYTFNAYVIGSDYKIIRDLLISALDDKNTAGIMTHPTLGIKKVRCTDFINTFSNTEGGMETFQITFSEAGKNVFPLSLIDTGLEVRDAVDAGLQFFNKTFGGNFNV